MRRVSLVLFLTIVFFSELAAQSSAPPTKPAATGNWGAVQNGKFISERLRLSLPIPSNFTVISTVDAEILASAGADLLKQGTASEKRIDEAVGRSILLVALAEKPIGSPQNSALELVVVKQQSGVTANMSLAASVMLLKGSPYSLKRSLGSVKIGSNTFAAAEFEASFGEIKFMQRMYVVMHSGYSIMCAITYFSDPQRAEMEKVLSTLSLTK
jgi:hypothetical protein